METLRAQAQRLAEDGEDSKFEKLRGVLRGSEFAREKFIVFTEHRDTAEFLVRRLEGLGFTGHVALIHGGLDYRDRETQVELFRRRLDEDGANYLVATDAAGEGINLQFCWLMVNYDVPWNPARLEQRMGRIHRYGQRHDPVVIVNLVAGETREGRVLKTLLEKLEAIRKELRSDKVFDVVGRLFENVSLRDYLEQATTDEGARSAIAGIEGLLTTEQVRALDERQRALFGGGDVKSNLPALREAMDQEQYRRLLPGYVRRFVTGAAPLVDLRVDGDPDGVFQLAAERRRGLDPVLGAVETYPARAHGRFTVYRPADRPADRSEVIWLHPGEPVFDRFCAVLLSRHEDEARRGAFFVDPHAEAPYLFHLARVSVVRRPAAVDSTGRGAGRGGARIDREEPRFETVESRLIGLRQGGAGDIEPCPLEHLLLLRGARGVAPGSVPLARVASGLAAAAREWINADALAHLVDEHRARIERSLPERLDWIARGCDHRTAELIARRQHIGRKARAGDAGAAAELARVKDEQRRFAADKDRRLRQVKLEPSLVVAGDVEMVAHALVLPTGDAGERDRHDARVEEIAMRIAQGYEETLGATVRDVSRPGARASRRAGGLAGLRPALDPPDGRPPCHRGEGPRAHWRRRAVGERVGQGLQPALRLLALRRLRLRHPPAAPRARPRPVREAAREEPRILRLWHPGVRGAGGGGGRRRGSCGRRAMTTPRAPTPERTVPGDPLAFIVRCVREGRIYWTYHVNMRLAGRHVSRRDICEATRTYELVEAYPDAKYLPSHLVLAGVAPSAFHVLFAADVAGDHVRVVTSYRPSANDWESDMKTRRP